MAIAVNCQGCHAGFHVADEVAGKRVRCPECGEPIRVPGDSTSGSIEIPWQTAQVPSNAGPLKSRSSGSPNRPSVQSDRQSSQQSAPQPLEPRKSVQENLARRKRSDQSSRSVQIQKSFPVGTAVAIGISLASVLICVAVVAFHRSAIDAFLKEDDQEFVVTSTIGQGSDSVDLTFEDHSQPVSSGDNSDPADHRSTEVNPLDSPTDGDSEEAQHSAQPDVRSDASSNESSDSGDIDSVASSSPSEPRPQPPLLESWAEVNRMVGPAVVRVNVKALKGNINGSGFVIDGEQGIVVTNYHVVEGASEVDLMFENGDRIEVDGYLHLDHKRDIALLKFDRMDSTQDELQALSVADVLPADGEEVAAFGAPVGVDFSMSEGSVNAVRSASAMKKHVGLNDSVGTWIQHNIPISRGNSGGPLVNKRGQVIGINTIQRVPGQDRNFAISGPDVVSAFAHQLEAMLVVNPGSAPVMTTRAAAVKAAQSSSGHSDIPLVDFSMDERGRELLAQMKTLRIQSDPFPADERGAVQGTVRNEACRAIDRAGIKLTMSRNNDYVMVTAMDLDSEDDRNVLTMNCRILSLDSRARRILKIWEMSDQVGTISPESLYQGALSSELKRSIKDYFRRVHEEIKQAGNVAVETDS